MSMSSFRISDGDPEDYEILFEEGQKIFKVVRQDLNLLSVKNIHTKSSGTSRRSQDYAEICVALAILIRKQIITKDLMKEQKNHVKH